MRLLTFDEYQEGTRRTAIYPGSAGQEGTLHDAVTYLALKLNGEAGEVAEKIGKFLRDGTAWADLVVDLEKELGDVLWYITRLADELDIDLITVAGQNLRKLRDRQERGTLQGSGDDR